MKASRNCPQPFPSSEPTSFVPLKIICEQLRKDNSARQASPSTPRKVVIGKRLFAPTEITSPLFFSSFRSAIIEQSGKGSILSCANSSPCKIAGKPLRPCCPILEELLEL